MDNAQTSDDAPASDVDAYIAAFAPPVQALLHKIRATIREAAPGAEEKISYRMPSFTLDGALVYYAAFKNHIGLYPPVRGDAKLMHDIAPYAGEKGNLRFPLDTPIPYALIARIVKARMRENRERAAARREKRRR
jgi:uncharacterized protein YdhG (YjbR/CyaY superfamily)